MTGQGSVASIQIENIPSRKNAGKVLTPYTVVKGQRSKGAAPYKGDLVRGPLEAEEASWGPTGSAGLVLVKSNMIRSKVTALEMLLYICRIHMMKVMMML